ncbi:UDP-N-acetylmuramate--L-alanine ligase [Pseudactinotalea sp. Z1732]|uniref:UDP-N-acetylmuramate--L-alanine ligase n=1 Tax=Micrococcales TaxID=85006 RepID=UPI003C7D1BE2
MRMHFIAIGGAGMSVIAELLVRQGYQVSGSDRADSPALARLGGLGARVHVGHAAEHVAELGPQDAVVISSAIGPDNPEVRAARDRGVPILHRSQALALAARGKDFVAVAGSHGKTTTSAMLAVALRAAGLDPSFAIGGRVVSMDTGAYQGEGTVFVAEADESDGSFVNYSPRVAIVTNIEADHLDHYRTAQAYAGAFLEFAARVQPGGLVITCADDPGATGFAAALRERGTRVQTYGVSTDADVRIDITHLAPGQSGARLTSALGAVELDVAVPGEHNLANAAAAWCAGVELGVDPAQMAAALGSFTGTARRFELRGTVAGVRVVDDYAHNPTKVAAAVATARRAAAGGRVIAVFQPHLYSRTRDFAEEFARVLRTADHVLLAPIYPAREEPLPGVTSALIADHLDGAEVIEDFAALAAAAAARAAPGDLVVTIGAGDVTALPELILAELGRR